MIPMTPYEIKTVEQLRLMSLPEIREYLEVGDRPAVIKEHDLPWDPVWLPTEMSMRHAALILARKSPPAQKHVCKAVAELELWGERWGLARHGDLFYATTHDGPVVSSYFKIVDLLGYTKQVRQDERSVLLGSPRPPRGLIVALSDNQGGECDLQDMWRSGGFAKDAAIAVWDWLRKQFLGEVDKP